MASALAEVSALKSSNVAFQGAINAITRDMGPSSKPEWDVVTLTEGELT